MPGERLLGYVPSDTAFFIGYTRPLPTGKLVSAWRDVVRRYLSGASELKPARAAAEDGPAVGLLVGLLRNQLAVLEGGGWPFAIHGFPPGGVIAAYSVSGIPVLRWQLADPKAFWRTINAAEQAAGVGAKTVAQGKLRLRRYALDASGQRQPLQLIFATGGGFALAMLAPGSADGEALDLALGVTKPADPIDPRQLNTLAWTYGLMPGTVGFVDNRRLLAPLAETRSEGLIDLITSLAAASGAPHPWLEALRSADCRDAVSLIPDFWPRTVVGLTGLDEATGRLRQRVVIETDQQRVLAELEDLRGYIPAVVRSPRAVLGVGLGLDFPSLVPAAEALDPPYGGATSDCPALADAQRQLIRSGTAAPGVVTALLRDANGVGAVVTGLQITADPAKPAKVDGGLVLSTQSPEEVWQTLKTVGGLEAEKPPEPGDDEPVALSRRFANGQTVRVVLREQAVALLVGDMEPPKPEEEGAAAPAPNGLLAFRYRYGAHSGAMAPAVDQWLAPMRPPEQRLVRRLLGVLKAAHVSLSMDVDVGDTGLEVDLAVTPGG